MKSIMIFVLILLLSSLRTTECRLLSYSELRDILAVQPMVLDDDDWVDDGDDDVLESRRRYTDEDGSGGCPSAVQRNRLLIRSSYGQAQPLGRQLLDLETAMVPSGLLHVAVKRPIYKRPVEEPIAFRYVI